MKPRPPRAPFRRVFAPVVAAVLFALLATSCDRQYPTAPATREPASRMTARPVTSAEWLNDVAVLPAPGTNVVQLAADYSATILGSPDYGCVRLVPPAGVTPDELVGKLAHDARVVAAERNAILETAETRQESYASDDGNGSFQTTLEQPATQAIGLAAAHGVSDGAGIKVAIIDTGVDFAHPLLASRLARGVDFVTYDYDPTDVVDGADSDGDGNIDEAYGHGTHVAGLVALAAPGAKLVPIRVLDADGRGDVASVTAGIRWAIDKGVRVINLSLGMLHPSPCIEKLLEVAEAQGIIVVCSAGNWGSENPREYPAISPRTIAVAATDASARPASFTSYGEHVALAAPGVGVRSAYPGGGWRLWSGTSMSAPLVSGTTALLLARHPSWSRDQVLARLSAGASTIFDVSPEQAGKLGTGMLQAGAALAPDFVQVPIEPADPDPVLRRP